MSASPESIAVNNEKRLKAVELWNAGLSTAAIAIRIQRSPWFVRDALKGQGKREYRMFCAGPEGGSGSKTRAGNYVRRT